MEKKKKGTGHGTTDCFQIGKGEHQSCILSPCLFNFYTELDFPGGSDGKASVYNAGDPDLIPGSGRSPEEGNGNPLQYSCLENPTEGEAWWATVHGVTRSRTRLSGFTSLHLFCLHWIFSSWVILYCLFECLIFLMDTKYYKLCFAEYWILYIPINNPELYFGVQLGYL